MVYWDGDGRKDLLVGQADGKIKLFLNVSTNDAPTFDGGMFLQVGPAGSKTDIDVGSRATLAIADWNNDGAKDLVVGDLGGKIRVFLNDGTDASPDFVSETFVQEDGSDLVVPSLRSSPVIRDLDHDGKKDLLTGNTNGQLLFYPNVGTDAAPDFSGYAFVESDGSPIDLAGTPRSRPTVCDWTSDGLLDVLIGADDGNVHLYQGVRVPGDFDGDGDVDQDDLDQFESCFTGPDGGPVPPECQPGDFDGDDDIDCDDWDRFKEVWDEPGDPPAPSQIPCRGIPTVSTWGTIAMTLLVLVAGTAVFQRRSQRPPKQAREVPD